MENLDFFFFFNLPPEAVWLGASVFSSIPK